MTSMQAQVGASRIDLTRIEKVTETIVVEGIRLPWVAYRYGTGEVRDRGEVFIPADTLCAVAEQDRWASQFGNPPLTLEYRVGLALEQAGLAEKETRGGFHGTEALTALVERMDW